jgi:pantothenate kinase type III
MVIEAVRENAGKVGSGVAAIFALGSLELGRRYLTLIEAKQAAQTIGTTKAMQCGVIQGKYEALQEVVRTCCGQ